MYRSAAGHDIPANPRNVALVTGAMPGSGALPCQITCMPELPPMHRRTLLALATLPLLAPCPASALDGPEGPVVLSLSGRLRQPNRGAVAAFDMAMLERLPQASFSTRTPWYAQARRFTGPLLRDLLSAVGSHATLMRAGALNGYRVDIPVDDAMRYDLLVARLLDDKPMSVRDKGPLFIIYPFDQHASLRNALYYSRCAWQLNTIDLL